MENQSKTMKVLNHLKPDTKIAIRFMEDGKPTTVKGQVNTINFKTQELTVETKNAYYELAFSEVLKISRQRRLLWFIAILPCIIALWFGFKYWDGCDKKKITYTVCVPYTDDCVTVYGDPEMQGEVKPIIYLYPEQETNVSVRVQYPENLTHTYPHYTNGWNVVAKPNGDLTDTATGRGLYALYWEGNVRPARTEHTEGFIIKGEETISFLEDKLAKLGLNEREAEEFIVYWLPKLESNSYNFIHFKSIEDQNIEMPLIVNPKPDTIIRVLMEYAALDNPFEIKEQVLPGTPVRKGFTLVEWGGSEISVNK